MALREQMTDQERQELQKKILLAREMRKRNAKADPAFFIHEFVKIEDRDIPGSVLSFDLWPEQERTLAAFSKKNRVIVLKSRQLGLTWLALAYASWLLVFHPGKSVAAISQTEDDAKELIRRLKFILRHLPDWMIREKEAGVSGLCWDGGTLRVQVSHPDRETAGQWLEPSTFHGHTSSPDAARSFTESLVILDEWAFHPRAEEIWTAAYPTINRPGGSGQIIGLSTGRIGTFFEQMWTDAQTGANSFHPIFLDWRSDPRRTREWYDQTQKDMNNYRAEYPATPEEAFTVGEGAFFATVWDPDIHMQFGREWYPPYSWRIVRSYDGGYNRACCLWFAISPDGWAVCYREYYPAGVVDPDQADAIYLMSRDPDGAPEEISYTVADTSCWKPSQDTGESTAEIFAKRRINMIQADKARENGWKRLVQHLRPWQEPEKKGGGYKARMMFTEACVNARRTLPALESSEANPDDIKGGQDDHVADALRYFVMSRPTPKPSKEEQEERRQERVKKQKPVVSNVTGW